MSIMCTVYLPEGIIMAADSRLTGSKTWLENGLERVIQYTISDNSQKLVLLNKVKAGISFCGDMMINNKTIADHIREFEIEMVNEKDTVTELTSKLLDYFKGKSKTTFYVCGYNDDVPYIFVIENNQIQCNNKDNYGKVLYNVSLGGQLEAILKLYSPMKANFNLMPLKDGIDFAKFIVETTINYERFNDDIQTCGGDVDILVITKDKAFWYKHKMYKL